MQLTLILANVGAVVTTLLGMFGLFFPDRAAAFVSVSPIGLNGRSEMRATYGGLFVALGVTCLVLQWGVVFMVAGIAWLGAAVGRIVSALIDKNGDVKNIGGIAIEAGVGALMICSIAV